MSHLIEDADGAPLPDELQWENDLWLAAYNIARDQGMDTEQASAAADAAMVAIAPILFPGFGAG